MSVIFSLKVLFWLSFPFVQGVSSLIANRESMQSAYEAVRDDYVDWALFGYEGKTIVHIKSGVGYDNFLAELKDDKRFYGYVRIEFGDQPAKFVFVTWIGPAVSPLKKAKVSTDKSFVKDILSDFAKEILADEKKDLELKKVKAIVEQASGAAYGTGRSG